MVDANGGLKIIGVHKGGIRVKEQNSEELVNVGRLLDKNVIEQLN